MEFNHFSKFELIAYKKYFNEMQKHAKQQSEKEILQLFINSINLNDGIIT